MHQVQQVVCGQTGALFIQSTVDRMLSGPFSYLSLNRMVPGPFSYLSVELCLVHSVVSQLNSAQSIKLSIDRRDSALSIKLSIDRWNSAQSMVPSPLSCL